VDVDEYVLDGVALPDCEELVEEGVCVVEPMQSEETTIKISRPIIISRVLFISSTKGSSSIPFYAFPRDHKN